MTGIDILVSDPGCQEDMVSVIESELGYSVDTESWLAKVKVLLGKKNYFALVLEPSRSSGPEDDNLVNEVLAIANDRGTSVLITTALKQDFLMEHFGIQQGKDYKDYLRKVYKTTELIKRLRNVVEG